jgi:hypothetical protein
MMLAFLWRHKNGMTHKVEELFKSLDMVKPYPVGVIAVKTRLRKTGFFPGGAGLWQGDSEELPPLPVGGTMVLGHNLDSERGFAKSVFRGGENLKGATWDALTKFLDAAMPDECARGNFFFTNFLIGLIAGPSASSVGIFPGTSNPDFVARCRTFLKTQIQVIRPSLLFVLGSQTPRLIAPLSPQLEHWNSAKKYADIDQGDGGFIPNANIAGNDLSIVALTHPCKRRLNVKYRRFDGFVGEAAEMEMVRRAVIASKKLS